MRIGELFVSLGFRVDSAPLEQTERSMEAAAIKAGKLALVVNAVNVALLAMVESATKAAIGLRIFEDTTGGSAESLQRWGAAAQVAGLKAGDLKAAVMTLLDARNAFALGEPQNVGAWSILGVNPTQDPFAVLAQLRERMKEIRDPNIMRALLGKVGLEGAMPVLQLPEAEFARFRREIAVSPQEIDRLVRLNREWRRLLVALTAVKNELSAALAPALGLVSRLLGALANGLTVVTRWLNDGGLAAKVVRFILGALAVAFLALGAAIVAATAALAGLAALLALLSPALLAVAAAAAPFLLIVGLIAAGVAGLILLLDDFWTAAEGGKSAFDWSVSLAAVDLMAKGIEKLIGLADRLSNVWRTIGDKTFGALDQRIYDMLEPGVIGNNANRGAAWFTPRAQAARNGGASVQNNNVEINVDGARSPAETGDAVARSLRKELETAAYQGPVPGY